MILNGERKILDNEWICSDGICSYFLFVDGYDWVYLLNIVKF